MATPILEVIYRFRDEASKSLADAEKGVENMGKTYKVAGAIMLGAGAAIGASLALCVRAAGQEEDSIRMLTVAMKNVGLSYDEAKGSLEKWMDVETKKTGVDDEKQRKSLAALILQTKDLTKAQDLLTLAVDIAAGTDRDLESATRLLEMAMAGNWGMLQRYIPAIKEAKTEEEKWAVLRQSFAGQGEAYGKSFQGQMSRMKSSIGELAETIGSVLLPAVTKIVNVVSGVLDWIRQLPPVVIWIGVTIAGAAAAVLTLAGTLSLLKAIIPKVITMLRSLGTALGLLGLTSLLNPLGLLVAAIGALAAVGVILWRTLGQDKSAIEELNPKIQELNNTIADENEQITAAKAELERLGVAYQHNQDNAGGYKDQIDTLNKSLETHQEQLADAEDELTRLEKEYNDAQTAVNDLEDAIADIDRELQGLESPQLVGMQKNKDDIQAIQEQIDNLKLQQFQFPEFYEYYQTDIDKLENDIARLKAEAKVAFGPQLYQIQKKAEAAQGLGTEVTPQTALDRIAELVGEKGVLNTGLVIAKGNLDLAKTAWEDQTIAVGLLRDTVVDEQKQIEILDDKVQELYKNDEKLILAQKNLIYDLGVEIAKTQGSLNALIATTQNLPSGYIGGYIGGGTIGPGTTIPIGPYNTWTDLQGNTGWTSANGMSGTGAPPELKEGGIVTRPTLAMMGERGPEAVIPLNRGNMIPQLVAAGYGGDINILISGNNFAVREEEDIDRIGQKLVDLIRLRTGLKI